MGTVAKVIVTLVGVAACSLSNPRAAMPACNAAPDPYSMKFRQSTQAEVDALLAGRHRYRGRMGSVDTVHWVPGVTKRISIRPDGCGSPTRIASIGNEKGLADSLAVAIMSPPTTDSPLVAMTVYASPAFCESLAAQAEVECVPNELELRGGALDASPFTLTVPLEPTEKSNSRLSPSVVRPGLAVVAAVPATETGSRQLREIAESVSNGADGDVCARTPVENGSLYACIHRIYADFPDKCATTLDGFSCELQGLPALNDFAEQCRDHTPDIKRCRHNPDKLHMLADNCGNLRIGFDWAGIYNDGKRWVEGGSGLSRSRSISPDVAIVVPGREFVGSTNPDPDKPGDPRRPIIKPQLGTSDELTLEGTVDQPTSIVHILARLEVDRVCDASPDCKNPEASLAVTDGADGNAKETDAHPIDRPGSVCNCVKINKARYFTCKGGEYEGRPCTRPAHCGSGFCTGIPTCQTAGAIWLENARPGSSTECNDDQGCLDADPAFPQCGYLLFDATEKKDESGTITLNSRFGGPKSERGVCETGRTKECKRDKDCVSLHCSGYVLRARGLVDD